ncbi:hypothetical protein J5N97_008627 [Dioscorea zingiberensis]|uniref:MADS-box domain-containing protein n=1 Tax=Dioscorea zingiberensis TaxID=325984 RepID=A0A9D5HLJ8_9LILI|nr:hypothetical protein J5N97_008627 [Dioscorea zingiberensis]
MQSSLIREKKTKGRQKIEIKKILNEDARHVTFSKRRLGLFKKASDLSTLCGADIALLVYSPSGKPYSFGSPTVDSVIQRYLSGNMEAVVVVPQEGELSTPSQNLNNKVMELSKRILEEKAKKVDMEIRLKELGSNYMVALSSNIKELQLHELEVLGEELNKLKNKANVRAEEIMAASSSLDKPLPMNSFNMDGSSNQDLPMMPYPTVNVDTLPGNMGYASFGPGYY